MPLLVAGRAGIVVLFCFKSAALFAAPKVVAPLTTNCTRTPLGVVLVATLPATVHVPFGAVGISYAVAATENSAAAIKPTSRIAADAIVDRAALAKLALD